MPKKLKKTAVPGSVAAQCSATASTFKEMFAKSRQRPIYWLEGVSLACDEMLKAWRHEQRRPYKTEELRNVIRGKIYAAKAIQRVINKIMTECGKSPNARSEERGDKAT